MGRVDVGKGGETRADPVKERVQRKLIRMGRAEGEWVGDTKKTRKVGGLGEVDTHG